MNTVMDLCSLWPSLLSYYHLIIDSIEIIMFYSVLKGFFQIANKIMSRKTVTWSLADGVVQLMCCVQ